MSERSRDWMAQAKCDLEHAAKDVKAVYMRRHADAWGHRVARLLEEMDLGASRPSPELIDDAKLLDQYYVPARYPNGFESGAPMDFFTREQAADAVRRADKIIKWCENIQGA